METKPILFTLFGVFNAGISYKTSQILGYELLKHIKKWQGNYFDIF